VTGPSAHSGDDSLHADPGLPVPSPAEGSAPSERCDYCGEPALVWRKCKLVCTACGNINKSCADL
jgi:hypothetical protein